MEKLLIRILGPLVNLLPGHWKTATGMLLLTANQILSLFSPEWQQGPWYDVVNTLTLGLTGVGLLHKSMQSQSSGK